MFLVNTVVLTLGIFVFLVQYTTGQQGVVVTTPSVVYSDGTHKTCITLQDLDRLDVIVSIKGPHIRNSHTLNSTTLHGSGCLEWDFGAYKNSLQGKYEFKVTGNHGSYQFKKHAYLKVKEGKHIIFIQTDKKIYKPQDEVQFRVLIVDSKLKPRLEKIHKVYITAPCGVWMTQWNNFEIPNNQQGIASFYFPLSEQPYFGKWTIYVIPHESGITEVASFKVKEYVLPTFAVTISAPSYIVLMDSSTKPRIQGQVCANYTYGEPVKGNLTLEFRAEYRGRPQVTRASYEIHGCETFDLNGPGSGLNLTINNSSKSVEMTALVYQNTTDESQGLRKNFKIDSSPYKFSFLPHSQGYFKPGFHYYGKLKVTQPDDKPVVEKEVNIKIQENGIYFDKIYISNSAGEVMFFVPSLSRNSSVMIKAIDPHNHVDNHHIRLKPWYSPSNSYLQIKPVNTIAQCGQTITLNTIHMKELGRRTYIRLYYKVIAHGTIISDGSQAHIYIDDGIHLCGGTTGRRPMVNVPLPIQVTSEMSPSMKVLVYYIREDKETVADSMTVKVEACTANDVSVTFTDEVKQPGNSTLIKVRAYPGSACSLRVVDKSVNVMGGKHALTLSQVMDELADYDLRDDYLKEMENYCKDKLRRKLGGRHRHWHYSKLKNIDSVYAFRTSGLLVLSDMTAYNPQCHDVIEESPGQSSGGDGFRRSHDNDLTPEPVLKIREYFPETWLWELYFVSETGSLSLDEILPHSITTWEASAFCSHTSQGLGVSPPTSIKGFLAFFLSLTLPYSVVRGEILHIPVTVFNYGSDCLVVELSLQYRNHTYDIEGKASHELCVCGHKSETRYYRIKPKKLGKIPIEVKAQTINKNGICDSSDSISQHFGDNDTVLRQLLVEAEGRQEEYTQTSFICPWQSGSRFIADTLQLDVPSNLIEDSERAVISTSGDVMGPTLKGLEKLLELPTGCGEQVMVKFAPNIYILQYLGLTNQLSESIESKAIKYLTEGYQNILTHRHRNGSYSVFPSKSGSTWLTAFVVKSLAQAQSFISIDGYNLEVSIKWLLNQQKTNGCFQKVGYVYDKSMRGGLSEGSNEIGLTAFVLISLLESQPYVTIPRITGAIESGFHCLTQQSITDTYSLTLMAYAYSLHTTTLTDKRRIMNLINERAIINGDQKHWSKPGPSENKRESVDVEMSSYVLMSYMENAGEEVIPTLLPIVKWISTQRNPYGGFSSTQNTVLALQALAKYAALTFSPGLNNSIRITSINEPTQSFSLNADNRIVTCETEVSLPNNVDIEVEGSGCVLTQARVNYNVANLSQTESRFNMEQLTVNNRSQCNRREIRICVSANKNANITDTNMPMVEVKMVSGWNPVKSTLDRVLNSFFGINKVEHSNNEVHFYFDKFQENWTCLEFDVEQKYVVQNTKPGYVSVYYYYSQKFKLIQQYEIDHSCPEPESILGLRPGPIEHEARVNYNVANLSQTESRFNMEQLTVNNRSQCNRREIRICVSANKNANITDTNMPMVEVKMVSGWNPVKSTLDRVINSFFGIKKFEHSNNEVHFYFDKFQENWTCLEFDVEQKYVVQNTKPGYVSVYYYHSQKFKLIQQYEIDHSCPEPESILGLRPGPIEHECPSCTSTVSFDLMEKFCSATNVYLVLIQSNKRYPIKVMTNQKNERRNRFIMRYTSVKMSPTCQCSQISSQMRGQFALIFTSGVELQPEEGNVSKKTLTLDSRTTVVSLSRSQRFTVEANLRQFLRDNRCA